MPLSPPDTADGVRSCQACPFQAPAMTQEKHDLPLSDSKPPTAAQYVALVQEMPDMEGAMPSEMVPMFRHDRPFQASPVAASPSSSFWAPNPTATQFLALTQDTSRRAQSGRQARGRACVSRHLVPFHTAAASPFP